MLKLNSSNSISLWDSYENTYLVNGFAWIVKNLNKHLPFEIIEIFPKPFRFDIVTNFLLYFFKQLRGNLKKYQVIHINTWENFLNAKKNEWQVLIWESHWFHFWLNFQETLKHFRWLKRIIAALIEFLLGWLIRFKIKKFDIYYVSTPNMLEFAQKIRPDASWLANAIDIDIFNPDWEKIALNWNPAIFYPTRLHSFKNPKFWIDLFQKIKIKHPEAVLHLIRYPNGADPLANYYAKTLTDPDTYVWHWFKTPRELASMYRSSDLVFWHFDPNLGMMSLIELEATACGAAVISHDRYEIHTPLSELENITFSILDNKEKRKDFVEKNREIVLSNHSPEKIAARLLSDIERIRSGIKIKALSAEIINDYFAELHEIEGQYFAGIGLWEKENFLYPVPMKFEISKVLIVNGKILGYLIASALNGTAHIHRFAINSSARGQWYGDMMLAEFINSISERNDIQKVTLIIHDSLDVGWFYEKNGFWKIMDDESILSYLQGKNQMELLTEFSWEKKIMTIMERII